MGPYESEEEILEAILYWQKRALKDEKWLENEADYVEELIDEILKERKHKEYWKQQFLDKDKELKMLVYKR
jgi:hypothetical protein